MTTYEVFEKLVLAAVLALAAWVAFGKLMPAARARLRGALAMIAARHGHATLARWLAPAGSSGGCGSGCSTCSSCGPAAPKGAKAPEREVPPMRVSVVAPPVSRRNGATPVVIAPPHAPATQRR